MAPGRAGLARWLASMGLELRMRSQLEWWMQPKVVAGVVVAAALALALAAAHALLQRTREHKKVRLPPGPRGLPVLGNLLLLARSKRWHADCYKMAETYGPIMWLRLGSQAAVVVQSPELAAEILKHQDSTFASRPRRLGYGPRLISYNGKDVLFSSGDHWRFMRKVVTVALLTSKRIRDFQHIRVEELGRMTESIGKHLGETVDLGYLLQALNLNNITRMCMSKAALSHYQVQDPQHCSKAAASRGEAQLGSTDEVPEDPELVYLLRKTMRILGVQGIGDAVPWLSFLDNLYLPKARMHQTQRQLHNYMCNIIQERRQYRADNPGTTIGDFVDALLSDSSSSEADGESPLTDTGICAQLTDIIIAGTDTSAITTEWAMAELLRHPENMAEAVQELDRVVGAARAVTEADVADLPFVQAVVKETLRLHPPGPMMAPHYSMRDATVGGYHVPANTTVLVNVWGVARDPAYWPHPHRFQPKRFLHEGATRADVDPFGHHFQLLPFGAGKRMCPGRTLGFGMVTFSLATLLHTFTRSLPADVVRPEDLDMTECAGEATICRELSLLDVPHPKLANKLAS